jgi:hypothetical protein
MSRKTLSRLQKKQILEHIFGQECMGKECIDFGGVWIHVIGWRKTLFDWLASYPYFLYIKGVTISISSYLVLPTKLSNHGIYKIFTQAVGQTSER